MTDTERLALIHQMLVDFWDNGTVSEDSAICLLNAILTVVNFQERTKKEC